MQRADELIREQLEFKKGDDVNIILAINLLVLALISGVFCSSHPDREAQESQEPNR